MHRNKSEKGNAILEFGLIVSVLIPLMFGTVAFGVNLGNMLQNVQITRDIAHMYARGKDFSLITNKNVAVDLVQGMGGMTINGGNGVLILSQVKKIYDSDCLAAGLLLADCDNNGLRVVTHRIVIGNTALRASNHGSPTAPCDITSDGGISSADYLTEPNCVATGIADADITQAAGDIAYIVEGYFATPSLAFLGVSSWGWGGAGATGGSTGTYTRAIF